MADIETGGWQPIETAPRDGDDLTMEKAWKVLQEMAGISDAMLRDAQAGQTIIRLNAGGTVSRVAPKDFYERAPLPQPPEAEK